MGSNSSLDLIPTTGGTKALTEALPYFSTMFWNYFIYSLILQFKNPVFLCHDLNPLFLEGTIFWISKILRDVLATRSRLTLSVRPHKCIWQDCARLLQLLGRGLNEDGTDILSGFFGHGHAFCQGVREEHRSNSVFTSHPWSSPFSLYLGQASLGCKAQLQALRYTFRTSISSPFWFVSGSAHHSLKTLGKFKCKQ